jgi:putative ABC transport system ATP-binding protein
VANGEFLAIVGPSGSGKSTMMNILGCLDRPTAGLYVLDGQPVDELDDDGLALVRSRSIGFVFQSYNLLPRTSALENVATPLMYQGIGKKERFRRAQAALERLGLGEPTGNLDSHSGAEVLDLFKDLHALGRTIVLITHDVDVAAAADRAVHLRDGQLQDVVIA